MVDWLSEWLRNIIAVILLAVFVELLLPSKAMQRYARLVVGLFVLLTILTPVLKLIQGDFEQRLTNGFGKWSMEYAQNGASMPSLDKIRQEAGALSSKREQEAGRLTEKMLEQQIGSLIEQRTKTDVASVQVELAGDDQNLQSVTVTMERPAASEGNQAAQPGVAPVDVDITVDAVEVDVNTEAGSEDEASEPDAAAGGEETIGSKEAWAPVQAGLDGQIRKLLQDTWAIDPKLIVIRQPAEGGKY